MRRMLALAMGAVLAVCAVGVRAQGTAPAPVPNTWETLAAANNLDAKGKVPFHLAMTFQLYDLDGKPSETGSLETWWTAPGKQRSLVQMAGLNENGRAPEGANATLVRDAYLVKDLLESAVRPVSTMQPPGGVVTRMVKSGKMELECTGPRLGAVDAMNASVGTACVEPHSTDALILQGLGGKMTMIRPKTAKFGDTFVALDLRIGFLGRDAIAGKVTTLEAYSAADLEMGASVATEPDAKAAQVTGGVSAGHRVRFTEPAFPEVAKIAHSSGSVLLNAIIGVDGNVRRLVPIASTAPMFTDAAAEAVKQWKYSPYLLNGLPVEVDTTVTVNFQIN